MKYKALLLTHGEPYSVFSEIIFKLFKLKYNNNFKRPIILVASKILIEKQMKKLGYSIKINEIKINDLKNKKLSNKYLNIINVDFKFNKIFDKITNLSSDYIKKCFDISLSILKKKEAFALVNGPISKTHFLNKKFLGVTEYLTKKTNSKNTVMLIYNSNFSVSPITTHLPVKKIVKNLSKKKIVNNVLLIKKFFKKKLNKNPKFAVLGLNPHCESIDKVSEEDKIIIPAINYLKAKKVNIKGPFSSDTFFEKKNLTKFDVAIGMYHDQVLIPIKTIYKFNAINITLGLPFIRISPDHGPNNVMLGKNKSSPDSLISSIKFLRKIK